jgi:hypothetical protein
MPAPCLFTSALFDTAPLANSNHIQSQQPQNLVRTRTFQGIRTGDMVAEHPGDYDIPHARAYPRIISLPQPENPVNKPIAICRVGHYAASGAGSEEFGFDID